MPTLTIETLREAVAKMESLQAEQPVWNGNIVENPLLVEYDTVLTPIFARRKKGKRKIWFKKGVRRDVVPKPSRQGFVVRGTLICHPAVANEIRKQLGSVSDFQKSDFAKYKPTYCMPTTFWPSPFIKQESIVKITGLA